MEVIGPGAYQLHRIRVGDRVTIYQRGQEKIWLADFFRHGRHCRQSLKTPNKVLALQRAHQLEVELTTGTCRQPPADVTVAQAVGPPRLPAPGCSRPKPAGRFPTGIIGSARVR
jgi:hypothetical protein